MERDRARYRLSGAPRVWIALWTASLVILQGPARGQSVPGGLDPTFRLQPGHYLLAGDEPSLTRLDLQRFDVAGPGKATERTHSAVTIFGPNGRERGRIVVQYDGMRKIVRLDGRIRDADGNVVRKLSKSDIQDLSAISDFSLYEDNRIRVAELFHDEYPYTVEYEVEVRYDGLLNWPTWYPQVHGEGVEYGALEIRIPADMVIRHTTRDMMLEPEIEDSARERLYRWSVHMIPPIEEEKYGPNLLEQVGSVHTAPSRFEIERTYGDMTSWASFGAWYANLSAGADALPSEVIREVQHLVSDANDDFEKARRLYAYLQQRTRYVSVQLGLGGWKPYPAGYVHERQYGDCKALSNYMVALLRAVGITAYPALIRTGSGAPAILHDFPSNQFNHVIAFVPLGRDTLWLETTSQTIPFGHIGANNEDRYALVVGDRGGELVRTPRSLPADNRQLRRGRIHLDADGNAVAEVITTYSGNQQDRLRRSLARASGKERDEWLHQAIDLPQFELLNADFSGVDRGSSTIKLPISLRLPNYATKGGARLFITPTLMDRWTTVPAADPDRSQDVEYFSYAFLDTDSLAYVLPEGYLVEALPDPVRIETDFGRFETASDLRSDGTLRYVRTFEVSKTRLPAASYAAFREFLSQVARSDRAQVVLVQGD